MRSWSQIASTHTSSSSGSLSSLVVGICWAHTSLLLLQLHHLCLFSIRCRITLQLIFGFKEEHVYADAADTRSMLKTLLPRHKRRCQANSHDEVPCGHKSSSSNRRRNNPLRCRRSSAPIVASLAPSVHERSTLQRQATRSFGEHGAGENNEQKEHQPWCTFTRETRSRGQHILSRDVFTQSVDSPTRSCSPPQQIGGSEDGYFPRDDRVICHHITVVCQPWKNSFSHATHNPAGDNRFPHLHNRRRSICILLSHKPGRPKYEAQAYFTQHPGRRQT